MAGWDDDWQRGDVLGDYQLVAKLGEGGMSRVYEGRHVALGTRVAIKTLRPEHRANANIRTRFEREGRATARIQHPHVVRVITVGKHRESPYLVMEFLSGKDFDQHLDARGAMAQYDALGLMMPVLSALQEAHDTGLIHRDLKPANIMLEEGNDGRTRPVVVDFGIARLVDGPVDSLQTRGSALLGTPAYMAPEQTRGTRELSAQSDQYALGVILHECLTGTVAFEGKTILELLTRVAAGSCVSLRIRRPDLPEGMVQAIERAMAIDPGERFGSVREFALALLPYADDLTRAQWTTSFSVVRPRVSREPLEPIEEPVRGERPEDRRKGTTLGGAAHSVDKAPRVEAIVWKARGELLAGVLAVALVVVLAGVAIGRRAPKSERFAAEVTVDPTTARIVVDGRAVGVGSWRGELAADGRAHVLHAEAEGFVGEDVTFVNASPPSVMRLRRRATAGVAAAAPAVSVNTVAVPVVPSAPAVANALPVAPTVEPARPVGGHGHRHGRELPRGNAPVPGTLTGPTVRAPSPPQRDPCIGPNGTNLCL